MTVGTVSPITWQGLYNQGPGTSAWQQANYQVEMPTFVAMGFTTAPPNPENDIKDSTPFPSISEKSTQFSGSSPGDSSTNLWQIIQQLLQEVTSGAGISGTSLSSLGQTIQELLSLIGGLQPGDITDPGSPGLPKVQIDAVTPTPIHTSAPAATPAAAPAAAPASGPAPANTGQYGQYTSIIEQASQQYGVPPGLIYSVIMQESGGNPNAVNPTSGCTGLMQLTPGEFSGDLTNPTNNIMQGTAYLAQLYQQKGGDWVATLAAYNLGPNANIDSTVPGQNGLTGRQYAEQVLARYENGV